MAVAEPAVAVLRTDEVGAESIGDGRRISAVRDTITIDELSERRAQRTSQHAMTAGFRKFATRSQKVLLVSDAVAALLAVVATTVITDAYHPAGVRGWLAAAGIALIVWSALILFAGGYRRSRLGSHGWFRPVITAAAAIVVIGALPAAWFGQDWLLGTVAVGAPTVAIGSAAARAVVSGHLRRGLRGGGTRRRVIMVGGPQDVDELCRAVARERVPGLHVAGVCVPVGSIDQAEAMGLPVAGSIDDVAAIATSLNCDAVAVTGADATRQSFLRQLAWSLEDVDVDLLVHPGLVDVARPRMHIQSFTGLPMLQVEQPKFAGWRRTIKRVMDIGLTGLGMLIIWPLLAAVALAVKLDDPKGPVIFKQRRVGIDGKPFTMYKFRSMVTDAEKRLAELKDRNEGSGPLFKIENDPRVTRVGHILRRYSLDELPQLFNVLGGSMSLVGPRPPLQSEVDEYAEDVRRRLKVMPGVTGMWQVSGRSMLSWEESVRLDLHYVENWSVRMDLMILFRTAYAVLAKRGAY